VDQRAFIEGVLKSGQGMGRREVRGGDEEAPKIALKMDF